MTRPYSVVAALADFGRYAGGGFLALAALLKYLFPDYSSAEVAWIPSSGWYTTLVVGEFILGVAILARLGGGSEAVVGAFVYTIFMVINMVLVISGGESCGCLGSVTVNPKVMLTVDTLMAVGLGIYVYHTGVRTKVLWLPALLSGAVVLAVVCVEPFVDGRNRLMAMVLNPEVVLEQSVIDLGERDASEEVEVRLSVYNRTSHPIRIVGASGSGVIRLGREVGDEIGPGQRGVVPVKILSKGAVGRRQTGGVIYVDAAGGLRELRFIAAWAVRA